MRWIGISGSWRQNAPSLKRDVEREVTEIIKRGDGIVTGGALGVDHIATACVVRLEPSLTLLKIILPTDLATYLAHYRKQAQNGVITAFQAREHGQLLKLVYKTRPQSLIWAQTGKMVNEKSYHARNKLIAEAAGELVAFQVNKSVGTQQTIDHARTIGNKVTVFRYKIKKI